MSPWPVADGEEPKPLMRGHEKSGRGLAPQDRIKQAMLVEAAWAEPEVPGESARIHLANPRPP